MDLGMSEGNDTPYYLSKGFKVIGVEADTGMCEQLRTRFAPDIATGALTVLNFAVGRTFGETIDIHAHRTHQALSGIGKRPEVPDHYVTYRVPTIDWRTIVAQAGTPRYLKIDVEGSEGAFLHSMLDVRMPSLLPEFLSVECYNFDYIQTLFDLGYHRFVIVDQNPPGGLKLPPRQFEGREVSSANFDHCSGPFGLDLFMANGWTDVETVRRDWPEAETFERTWFDCHVWRPN